MLFIMTRFFKSIWTSSVNAVVLLTIASAEDVDLTKLPPAANVPVDFSREIYPIFKESCVQCHGPDKHKGNYRLDTKEGAFKPGKDGPNIIPGNSAKSPLIQMVAGLVEDGLMPPPDAKGNPEPLTKIQIGLLRAWIDRVASWPNGPIPEFTKELSFIRDIEPILTPSCVECHGPTQTKGGLRLDQREGLLKGGKNYGPSIIPGNSARSPLIIVVTGKDEDLPLPEKHKLDSKKAQLIGKWIDQGAN